MSPCAGTILYFPVTNSVAPLSRDIFNAVARLGRLASGTRSRCCVTFRSPFDTTFSPGTLSNSDSDSAKLSPTQLNSGFPDVFSNGSTITLSVNFTWAAAAKTPAIIMNTNIKNLLTIIIRRRFRPQMNTDKHR